MIKRKGPERRREILAATLKVLRSEGANGASTAKIAAAANCSKETIYNWFGDRDGLFAALVEEQSEVMLGALNTAVDAHSDVLPMLEAFGAAMLDLSTGEASVLVTRAVIGGLGNDHEQAGMLLDARGLQFKGFGIGILERAAYEGIMHFRDMDEAWVTFYGLVVGERQILTIIGIRNCRPPGHEMNEIAKNAVQKMLTIYSPSPNP